MVDSVSPPWVAGGFTAGSRVAGYQLIELVGRGGMAVVFRAYDDRLNRQVALKILAPVLAEDEAFRQRFIRESRAAAAVDDPNIIPVFEAGEADGVLFIAMRLVRGGNLRSLVAVNGPLSPGRAEWIVSAVASALDTSHAAGLVHRDVKPANILLETRRGRPDHVYLSDFGLSKAALGSSGLTGSGQFLGTVDYAAPEQIRGQAVDGRTDQYALGCSAFELLCGQPPFLRDQGLAAIYAHLSEPPPSLVALRPELPGEADAVIAKVLAKDAAGRYASCQEFADALRDALGLRPYVDPAEQAPQRRATDVVWPVAGEPAGDGGVPADAPAAFDAGPPTESIPARPGAAIAPDAPEPDGPQPDAPEPAVPESLAAGPGSPGPAAAEPHPPEPVAAKSDFPGPDAPDGRPAGRRWLKPWPLAIAAVALAGVATASVILLGGGSGSGQPGQATRPVTHRIAPQRIHGVIIARLWKLAGHRGSRLSVTITARSSTGKALSVRFSEPIPAFLAPLLPAGISFSPSPARVEVAQRIVTWTLNVPAHGQVTVGYHAKVAPDGASRARLDGWIKSFDAAARNASISSAAARLLALAITPHNVKITAGHTAQLTLSGQMSDHSVAAGSVLGNVHWQSSDPAVATVRLGKVTARSAGTARITARAGTVATSIVVTVRARRAAGSGPAQPTYVAPTNGPTSNPATPTPHPSSNPTPTLTPSPLAQPR